MTAIETIYFVGALITGAIVLSLNYYGKVFVDEFRVMKQGERLGFMLALAAIWPVTLVVLAMSIKVHIRFPEQWW